jgi:hypothetical protein
VRLGGCQHMANPATTMANCGGLDDVGPGPRPRESATGSSEGHWLRQTRAWWWVDAGWAGVD